MDAADDHDTNGTKRRLHDLQQGWHRQVAGFQVVVLGVSNQARDSQRCCECGVDVLTLR